MHHATPTTPLSEGSVTNTSVVPTPPAVLYDVASNDRVYDMVSATADRDDDGAVYSLASDDAPGDTVYALANTEKRGAEADYALAGDGADGGGAVYDTAKPATRDDGGPDYDTAHRKSMIYDTANRQSQLYDGATMFGVEATYNDAPVVGSISECNSPDVPPDSTHDPESVAVPFYPMAPAEPWNQSRKGGISKKKPSVFGRMFGASTK